jgi:hypothetical protein
MLTTGESPRRPNTEVLQVLELQVFRFQRYCIAFGYVSQSMLPVGRLFISFGVECLLEAKCRSFATSRCFACMCGTMSSCEQLVVHTDFAMLYCTSLQPRSSLIRGIICTLLKYTSLPHAKFYRQLSPLAQELGTMLSWLRIEFGRWRSPPHSVAPAARLTPHVKPGQDAPKPGCALESAEIVPK